MDVPSSGVPSRDTGRKTSKRRQPGSWARQLWACSCKVERRAGCWFSAARNSTRMATGLPSPRPAIVVFALGGYEGGGGGCGMCARVGEKEGKAFACGCWWTLPFPLLFVAVAVAAAASPSSGLGGQIRQVLCLLAAGRSSSLHLWSCFFFSSSSSHFLSLLLPYRFLPPSSSSSAAGWLRSVRACPHTHTRSIKHILSLYSPTHPPTHPPLPQSSNITQMM